MAEWQNPETLRWWVFFGFLLFAVLVGSLVYFTKIYLSKRLIHQKKIFELESNYQKRLLEDGIAVQEQERRRFAADLHDGLISELNIALLKHHKSKEDVSSIIENCIHSARRISHDLSPPLLENLSLCELIQGVLQDYNSLFDIQWKCDEGGYTLNDNLKIHLLRITQEIVTNCVKHSKANTLLVELKQKNNDIIFKIEDDGVGFEKKPNGLGISNIEMRSQLLKAKLERHSKPGNGSSYSFIIPISAPQ